MKTFEITKEQIEQLVNLSEDNKYPLKQWFPDAFKSFTGWAKDEREFLKVNELWICYYEDSKAKYGIGSDGNWFVSKTNSGFDSDGNNREATPQEVESALIAEAKKRGFTKNISYTITNGDNIIESKNSERFGFDDYSNKLLFNNWSIFENGQWATIIPQKKMTKEQIEKELGYKIEIV